MHHSSAELSEQFDFVSEGLETVHVGWNFIEYLS